MAVVHKVGVKCSVVLMSGIQEGKITVWRPANDKQPSTVKQTSLTSKNVVC